MQIADFFLTVLATDLLAGVVFAGLLVTRCVGQVDHSVSETSVGVSTLRNAPIRSAHLTRHSSNLLQEFWSQAA